MAQDHGLELLDFYHSAYPQLLSLIPDPPNLLMAKGNTELLKQKAIGMVGSRKASRFAKRECFELARILAEDGFVIVSGGAIGCDMASHLGALASPLRPVPTILVFAGGLSRLYPRCHEIYFKELLAAGALFLSERLWSYPARPYDFPVRNRIISGLVLQLLVMQAGERSGAKLTAGLALEQGRDVFVLVHDTDDIRAEGSRRLLCEGALPFHSAQDFLTLSYPLG
jgi:DNA processing protein